MQHPRALQPDTDRTPAPARCRGRSRYPVTAGLFLIAVLAYAWVPGLAADPDIQTSVEIDFLLTAVGDSGCSFLRNGKAYSSADAEAHLRMKYQRGRHYASTTEQFIVRLASSSSMSGKPRRRAVAIGIVPHCAESRQSRRGQARPLSRR
jgi:hypothetical protein